MFPNIGGAQDAAGLAGVMAALAPLDETTVVKQLLSGARLAVQRGVTGEYDYRFLDVPAHCHPGLVLVENYRLTAYPARYGAGRVIKTFSLLPGERTNIRLNTYKRSSSALQQASSILDSTNSETEQEFTNSVNREQSTQENTSKNFRSPGVRRGRGTGHLGLGQREGQGERRRLRRQQQRPGGVREEPHQRGQPERRTRDLSPRHPGRHQPGHQAGGGRGAGGRTGPWRTSTSAPAPSTSSSAR